MSEEKPSQNGNQFPDKVVDAKQESNVFVFRCENDACLMLSVLRADVLRFRYNSESIFDADYSYAIADNFESGVDNVEMSEDKDGWVVKTSALSCRISRKGMKASIYNADGDLLSQDEHGFHWQEHLQYGGIVPKMSKFNHSGQRYYGLGDKPMGLDLAGKRVRNWNTDEYAFLPGQDPLYKSIPFYVSLHKGLAHGIFFDNSFVSYFDFGNEREDVTSFWADGGEMNYYFIQGPGIEAVASTYAQLTGTHDLPPLWALGYHQCKWSYYPDTRVREVAKKFRRLKIPCDALYLDIDYMDGFRCFTWDSERFPDPKGLLDDLKDDGFHTVVIIDPGIKVDKDYWVYKEGVEKGYFCRRADGPFVHGRVWPGDCLYPDFTNPKVREWWSGLFKGLVESGVDGVWNDMNEPAVMEVPEKTFPLDVRHDYDGHPCSHRKAHNVYGMQMARATFEGLKKLAFPRRPFVITRAAYAGSQRYCSTWTGDNIASWDHLRVANQQLQRMNLSGMGFCSSDIGGFEEQPEPGLYARWIQMGVFHPFCRTHSSGHHGDQEPWAFGEETLEIARNSIRLRYELLLYLYTTFYEHMRHGTPMLRSLVMEDQSDDNLAEAEDDFMFGRHILVSPIMTAKPGKTHAVYLPKGTWYELESGQERMGQHKFTVPVTPKSIPVFVRAGAVIARLPVQQYVGEDESDELRLDVYFSKDEVTTHLYEDSYDGYDYKVSGYLLRTFTVSGSSLGKLCVRQSRNGKFPSRYRTLRINLTGLPFRIANVSIDGKATTHPADTLNPSTIIAPEDFHEIHVS